MPTQKDRILQLLGDRGELGVLNIGTKRKGTAPSFVDSWT